MVIKARLCCISFQQTQEYAIHATPGKIARTFRAESVLVTCSFYWKTW